jgi:hypothetical protein
MEFLMNNLLKWNMRFSYKSNKTSIWKLVVMRLSTKNRNLSFSNKKNKKEKKRNRKK